MSIHEAGCGESGIFRCLLNRHRESHGLLAPYFFKEVFQIFVQIL